METAIGQQFEKKKQKKGRDLIRENGSVSVNSCPTEGYLEVSEVQERDIRENRAERKKKKKKKKKDSSAENRIDNELEKENSGGEGREVSGILDSPSQESKHGRKKKNKYLEAENGLNKELEEAGRIKKKKKHNHLEAVNSLEKELEEENRGAVSREAAEIQDSGRIGNAEVGKKKKKNKDVKCENFNENGYQESPWRKEKKKNAGIETEELSGENSKKRKNKSLLDDEIDEIPLRYHGGEKDQFNDNSVEENPSEYISVENPEHFANGRSKEKRKKKRKERDIVSGDDDNHWRTGDTNTPKDADKSSTDGRSLYKTQKKVTFSSQVQVCGTEERMDKEVSEDRGVPGGIPNTDEQDQKVWGKRFGPEEDQAIRDAISKYIKEHGLAEDEGLQMILNCQKYAKVRDCWKDISASLPWRPAKSVYIRAHLLYERSNERRWTQDEIDGLRRLYNEQGKKWKKIAQVLGKSRYHVKDKWRVVRRGVQKRGQMSQDEYQRLSDLVHYNLQIKLPEKEQNRTHRRLRDNINWEAIADKMETRDHIFCCRKWYGSFVSSLIDAGLWESGDDKILLRSLLETNASDEEAVDWDDLVKGRSGEVCFKRWKQMQRQLGDLSRKQLFEKLDLLVRRYAPELIE